MGWVPDGQSLAAAKVLDGIQTPMVPSAPIEPVAWQVELVFAQSVAGVTTPVAGSAVAGEQSATQACSPAAAPKQVPLTVLPSWSKVQAVPKLDISMVRFVYTTAAAAKPACVTHA